MAPLEPWEKVLVDGEKFPASAHGQKSCVDCHAGSSSTADKESAHTGLIADPSVDAQQVCGECHSDQVAAYPGSLHATQQGYWTAIETRSLPEAHPALEEMFGNHCATCHTTCGECHVSQPQNVGGGLFTGHLFEKTPPMTRSCTACHGSRVGNEFLGKNEELPGDVHFREARMSCVKCHTGAELHGQMPESASQTNRYDGAQIPGCTDCHAEPAEGAEQNVMHQAHGDKLSCQVCHSISYTSCDGCHVQISEKSGKPMFETQATYSTFLIGMNPLKDELRPYNYVPVRHIPIAPTSYQFYGEDLLPNFNQMSTWAYATPHNIQRSTPQTSACENCHAASDLFLTEDKVKVEELEANTAVIVTNLPPSMDEIDNAIAMPDTHTGMNGACSTCHDGNTAPALPENHAGRLETACTVCHKIAQ